MRRIPIIAEAGVNHNGDIEKALQLVDAAHAAGADIVKFQTFKSEKLTGHSAKKADYQTTNLGKDNNDSQLEMLKKLELSEKDHLLIAQRCAEKGIEFLSTPFDVESMHFLVNELKIKRIKIPSGEVTNPFLLLASTKTRREIILSTGMCTLGDVEAALGVLAFGLTSDANPKGSRDFTRAFASRAGQDALKEFVTILHCTTEYPAPLDQINLNVLKTLRQAFQLPVGYSDHTMGVTIPIAAVAKGAVLIEKHFTLSRSMEGPDHVASLEPHELRIMVDGIRQVEKALGSSVKIPSEAELKNRLPARKSLVAARRISKGEILTLEAFTAKRPASGVSPLMLWDLIGKPSPRSFDEDEIIEL